MDETVSISACREIACAHAARAFRQTAAPLSMENPIDGGAFLPLQFQAAYFKE
ncbi:MAG: hypothetical protein SPF51_08925 [Candidatus Fimivicinus sp.]|nr:hypothetical protein [Oscillospiraceae bacterium]MDY5591645.1 hypothetical protein [Candidatus Fimivicinus sp.]